jgi:hypothetical protein
MEEMQCAMALKSANGRQTHRTKTGLPVCCEQALKSVGEQRTYYIRGTAAGAFGKPPAKEVALRGGVKRLCMV